MFDHLINPYLLNPDEAYSVAWPFDKVVGFVKFVAQESEYATTKDILAIEIPEGVFIRAQDVEWCKTLTGYAKDKKAGFPITIIGTKEWEGLTRKYRSPINSFGDEKLARWKVGF